jgi:hypothetical protein
LVKHSANQNTSMTAFLLILILLVVPDTDAALGFRYGDTTVGTCGSATTVYTCPNLDCSSCNETCSTTLESGKYWRYKCGIKLYGYMALAYDKANCTGNVISSGFGEVGNCIYPGGPYSYMTVHDGVSISTRTYTSRTDCTGIYNQVEFARPNKCGIYNAMYSNVGICDGKTITLPTATVKPFSTPKLSRQNNANLVVVVPYFFVTLLFFI